MTAPPHTPPAPEATLNALKRMLHERTAWNELPEWGFLESHDEASVTVRTVPVPTEVWKGFGYHPGRLLNAMADLLAHPRGLAQQKVSDSMRSVPPPGLCGVWVRSEAWSPPEHMMEEVQRAQAAGARIDYATLPGRRESRSALAVDATGRRFYARQYRNDPRIHADWEGRDGCSLGGNIPRALERLLRAQLTPPPVPNTFRRAAAD